MATTTQNVPLRRGAMNQQGALYDFLFNVKELLNAVTGASLTLEGGSAPSATLAATAAELNAVADVSTRVVAAGSTLAVTAALHAEKVVALDTLTGSVCTLPIATGTGNRYIFITKVIATSNSHIVKVGDATDNMGGVLVAGDNADGTATAFGTQADSDTITLNRTTTGSAKIGDWIECIDIATNQWAVRGHVLATGSEANPFSATV